MNDSEQTTSRREFLLAALATGLVVEVSSCGTVFFPERVGQRRGTFRELDWTVVGMDAIGLVFFFVPGVIAFAVDFYNGAIFMPAPYYGQNSEHGQMDGNELKEIPLPTQQPSLAMVEKAVADEVGQPVKLEKDNFVSRKLTSIKEFWTAHREIEASTPS